jgi:hypothetical protein
MKTETPQLIHRQDYTPPPFLVDHVDLDVQFHADAVLVTSHLQLRRNPAARPGSRCNSTAMGWQHSRSPSMDSRSAQTTTPAPTRR